MALLAIVAVLGGDFSRRGYQRRIAVSSSIAVTLQLVALVAVSAGEDDPNVNIVQYAVPLIAFGVLCYMFFWGRARKLAANARRLEGAAA